MTSEGFWRDLLLLDVNVNQWLHGFHLLVRHEFIILCNRHKMHETHVKNLMLVDVEERVLPMAVIQMRIATEHLLHDSLAILVKGLGESTTLSNPILGRRICR